MSQSTRWAVAAAGIGLIVVLFLALRPGDDPQPSVQASTPVSSPTGASSPTETPAPTPTPTVDAVEIEIELEEGQVEGRAQYTVTAGERVRIEVASDVADEVHVHGYDLIDEVRPGRPAVIAFRADAPGVFEVELEEAGMLLFRLRVTA